MKPKPTREDGPITKALMEAVAMRRQLLDSGTPEHEANRIVGQGLKSLLGNKREQPWRFYCADCRDTGWIDVQPNAEEQKRLMHLYGDTTSHAGFLSKCEPMTCKWQQREREQRRQKAGQEFGEEDFVSAGQTQKPGRKFTKFGG